MRLSSVCDKFSDEVLGRDAHPTSKKKIIQQVDRKEIPTRWNYSTALLKEGIEAAEAAHENETKTSQRKPSCHGMM